MGINKLIQEQGEAMNLLTNMLKTHVDSYRLLIASASELNNIYEARSSQVKVVIKRAKAIGEIIDEITEILEECAHPYYHYCIEKGKAIYSKTPSDLIFTEVTNELSFQNSTVRPDEQE